MDGALTKAAQHMLGEGDLSTYYHRVDFGHSGENKFDFYEKSNFTSARNVAIRYKEKNFDPSKRTEYLAKIMYNEILELKHFDYSNE